MQHVKGAYGKSQYHSYCALATNLCDHFLLCLLLVKEKLNITVTFQNSRKYQVLYRYTLHFRTEQSTTFPSIYCPNGNVINFFTHQLNMFLYNTNTLNNPMMQTMDKKKPPKPPFPFWECGPHLIHQSPSQPHSPPQMATRLPHSLLQNYATKSPLVTMGCAPKLPLTMG